MKLDPKKTAMVTLDFQTGILAMAKGTESVILILRSQGIENLVFFGVSTSGIVLSTIRRAFDLDFKCIILKDACFDGDEEVHRVLTEKIFVRQATVLSVDAFIAEQA